MEYTFLGRSGLKVSRLALGTMNFGPLTEEKEAFRIMDEALDMGINFFDTANMYGSMTQEGYCGWTEEIIGRWFKLGGNRRERVVLSTKLYLPMNDKTYGPNDGNGLSAYKIKRNLEDSLRRLQTDYIDLYLMHRAERRTPWEELWGGFERAVNDGKILYVGSSNFNAYDLGKAQWAAEKRGFLGMVVEQHRYNLLSRSCEAELLPAADELGVGIMCWSPLAGGLLGNNGKEKIAGTRRGLGTDLTNETYKQLESYSSLCQEIGKSEADVALAWLMVQPTVTCPIMGPRTLKNLRDSVKSVNVKLDKDVLDRLDEIFPKVGPIPEGEILE